MSDRLFALRLFARVARVGSFSAAARELGLSQSSASRIVAELERELGAALLTRTTRAVRPTEAGLDYLARIEGVLAELDEADHAARGARELRGTLRVAMSSSFGVREIVPLLPAFLARHPALKVEFLLSDRRADTLREGVDVAIRLGPLADSSAVARRLATTRRVIVASPAYLERAGEPAQPSQLASHALILGPAGTLPAGWTFACDGRTETIDVDTRLSFSVNEGAVGAAVAGLGIVSTATWGCRAELERGTLRRVLPAWTMPDVDAHGLFAPGRAPKPAAKAFVDYLAEALASVPPMRSVPPT